LKLKAGRWYQGTGYSDHIYVIRLTTTNEHGGASHDYISIGATNEFWPDAPIVLQSEWFKYAPTMKELQLAFRAIFEGMQQ
jgi:hypothetical protein